MTEIEVPIEKVQEDLHHHAQHHGTDRLVSGGALLSAFLAVFAAISALMAGRYANEAMMEQIQSSDQWAHYQAKGIKLAISDLKADLTKNETAQQKTDSYKKEQEEIKAEAETKEAESRVHLHQHETLATAVTFFQIAIAMTAISVLTRKKSFLFFALGLGVFGLFWMIKTFLPF
jgi:1-aminocyclopropane-1-carboxylate deaminase/D-cysteine desulfhydrase-like pyridoxal-dependent ACC family enzyme